MREVAEVLQRYLALIANQPTENPTLKETRQRSGGNLILALLAASDALMSSSSWRFAIISPSKRRLRQDARDREEDGGRIGRRAFLR